ncbi:TDR15 protein, partial [Baryphthengus martii]|nr:TDR15 protein [Baryphthengus martii]
WHRGRVLEKRENICEAFLIDTGQVLVVEETRLASACDELFQLPPKVVLGVFASILPLGEKWAPKAINYFSSLVGLQITGHVKAVIPYQLFVLEVPKIISDALDLRLGKFIDGDSFCFIVQTLRAFPQEMLCVRMPQLSRQKYPVKELLTSSNSEKPTDFWPVPYNLFPCLPVGSKENVKITVVISPNKFYCQIQKWQKELEDLTRAMHLYYEAISAENNSFDNLGLLCAAKRENGQWHRGVIKQFLFDHVEVWFMDFGNIEAVPSSCVKKLTAEFMVLPMISFPCALSCFGSGDETAMKTQLKELMQALIAQTSVCICVDLFNNINRLYYITLQNQKLGIDAKHPENWSEAAASCVSLPETKIPSIAGNDKPHHERNSSLKSCTGNNHTKNCLPELDISFSSHCKRLEMKVNSCHTAFVVYVINPSNFWIRMCEYQNEFQALMKNIADMYNQCGADEMVLKNPEPGLLCCARYSKDLHYYRGVVIEVLHVNITVYFLDFGNTDTVPYYDVKTLLPEFFDLPALAVCCALAFTFPVDNVWIKKEIDFFKEMVLNRVLLFHVIGKQNSKYIVKALFRNGLQQENVATCMIQAGYAEYWEMTPDSVPNLAKSQRSPHKLKNKKVNPQSTSNICKNKVSGSGKVSQEEESQSMPSVLRESVVLSCFGKGAVSKRHKLVFEEKSCFKGLVFKPGAVLEVVCSCIVSPVDFSCQLQSKLPELTKLMDHIQTYYKDHTSPYETGEIACIAKYPKDEKWYRATVVQQVSTNEVDVVFVDYGYRERVLLKDLQAVVPDFLTLESQAFRCRLKNVPLQTDSLSWSEEAHRHFRDFISASRGPLTCIIYAVVLVSPNSVCNIVDLQTPSSSAEEFLREHGLTQSEYTDMTNLASLGSLYSFCYSSFNIKIGNEEEVYITHIHSPSKFYCQLNRNSETIEALMKRVSVISKMSHNAEYDTSNMRLCLARYFEDGLFYRALSFPVESTSFLCADFVDFGNKSMVERDQLMPIPDSATDLIFTPMQAIKCCLSDLRETRVPARVTRWFENTFHGKLLKAVIVSRESNGKIVVELYDGQLKVSRKIKEKILEELALKNYMEQFYYKTDTGEKVGDEEQTAHSAQKLCSGSSKPRTSQNTEELGFRNTVGAVLQHREEPVVGQAASHTVCHPALNSKDVTVDALSESHERQNQSGQQEMSNESIPKLISLPQRDFKVNSEVLVLISHMNSPSSFYVQLAEDENLIIQLAKELNESMVNVGENDLEELMIGDVIVAEHDTDCVYCRAVIKSLKSRSSFEVEFIDYGAAAVVSSSKICRIQKKFLTFPRLSVHCFLSRVRSVPDESWTNEMTSYFVRKVNKKPVTCKFLQQHGEQWEIDVICDGKEVLLQEHLNQILSYQSTVGSEKSSNTSCKEFEFISNDVSITWMLLHSGRSYPGFATAVTDPSNFCIQFEFLFNCMKNLALLLSELPDNLPVLPKELVAPGVSCLIRFELEEQWNRAEIIEVTSQSVVLTFIDYGFQKSISYSDINKLKVIPESLSLLPRLAHSCSLHDL